ncbi:hypothetical protein T4A_11691 [Trichinella pseudospiralis]|uniref:Uncharacterized protein n=1 Tax=Trichinella pseudospiralis TaxID=6337 RepID=A0A0V1EQR2_TRIPS|nr:hypothetical protein T4A_5297 [Trichinella pseudospiralis]KRY76060.1 hypothetical protein T4A_11691 [Trichinella pseudospiralis]
MHKNDERHLAGVVVVHAMCRCMPYQFLICEEDAMSSSTPMLNVMKTDIEGKRLTTNPRPASIETFPENCTAGEARRVEYRRQRRSVSSMTQHRHIYMCLLCLFVHVDNILQINQISISPAMPVT